MHECTYSFLPCYVLFNFRFLSDSITEFVYLQFHLLSLLSLHKAVATNLTEWTCTCEYISCYKIKGIFQWLCFRSPTCKSLLELVSDIIGNIDPKYKIVVALIPGILPVEEKMIRIVREAKNKQELQGTFFMVTKF